MEVEQRTVKGPVDAQHLPPDGGGLPCLGVLPPSEDFPEDTVCEDGKLLRQEETDCGVDSKVEGLNEAEKSNLRTEIPVQVTSDLNNGEEYDATADENRKTAECTAASNEENSLERNVSTSDNAEVRVKNNLNSVTQDGGEQCEKGLDIVFESNSLACLTSSFDKRTENSKSHFEAFKSDYISLLSGKNLGSPSLSSTQELLHDPIVSCEEIERGKSSCQSNAEFVPSEEVLDGPQISVGSKANYSSTLTNIHDQCLVKDTLQPSSSSPLVSTSTLTSREEELSDSNETVTYVDSHSHNHALSTHSLGNDCSEGDETSCANEVHKESLDCCEENPIPISRHCTEESLSSYKQHPSNQIELDIETDDEDGRIAFVSPSIYQSYEESPPTSHFQMREGADSSLGCSIIAEYNTCSADSSVCSPAFKTSAGANNLESSPSNASTCTPTSAQNTLKETSSSLQNYTSTSHSAHSVSVCSNNETEHLMVPSVDEHGGALCTGDQSFKTSAARQSALEPFLRPNHSNLLVSGVNQSGHKAALVQGMPQQTTLSSTVQFAHHHGGRTTIMQHQSLSAGMAGGVAAQATALQQHGGATSVLQQRTMTNAGQTVLVQQRIMTTCQGAVNQQALLQQRLAAQAAQAAQAALYHAGRPVRHQAMQQVLGLPQRRVVDASMYQTQALTGTGIIAGGTHALIGQRLVQGGTPQSSIMQHLVRQRYLGGPVMPGRVQMVAGRPVRIKMTYPRETISNT
ncbi:hely protein [Elysia marginata]|uniref:Hely protein n=1 Tax=Elysia marginata TaxID=1093978 RepID=A0AAV4EII3_9GAST|nr:hely protein [Elysia marginata]